MASTTAVISWISSALEIPGISDSSRNASTHSPATSQRAQPSSPDEDRWQAARDLAAETFARITPLLAQTLRIRHSPNGGEDFPGGVHERPLSPHRPKLPDRPTAIAVFDRARGEGRLLVADLDVTKAQATGLTRQAATELVATEATALIELIQRCGGRAISDVSPSGGRHVYIRWARPLPWPDLRDIAHALAQRFISFDTSPMSGPAAQIRTPGSLHKFAAGGSGRLSGYLRLTIPIADAEAILRRPCGPKVWAALQEELTAERAVLAAGRRPRSSSSAEPGSDDDQTVRDAAAWSGSGQTCPSCAAIIDVPLDNAGSLWLPRRGGRRAPRADLDQLARSGDWQSRRTKSASELRLSVLNSIAAAGWRLGEVIQEMEHGRWPGLARLLESKRPSQHRRRLEGDWRKAVTGVAWQRHVRRCNTSPRQPSTPPLVSPTTEGGGATPAVVQKSGLYIVDSKEAAASPDSDSSHPRERNIWGVRTIDPDVATQRVLDHWQQILQWRTAVYLAERDEERVRNWGRAAPQIRMLLRGMAVAARKDGSTCPAFGARSLSQLVGMDYTTVARHLKRLREEDNSLIDRVEEASGKRADRYELSVPDIYKAEARWIRWRGGRIDCLHPALHALGAVVALVYEQLNSVETGSTELARLTLISTSATAEALRTLAQLGLAERGRAGWYRGDRPLEEVAVELGADVIARERRKQYRKHREDWWALLEAWQLPPADRPDHLQPRRRTQAPHVLDATAGEEAPWPEEPVDNGEAGAYDYLEQNDELSLAPGLGTSEVAGNPTLERGGLGETERSVLLVHASSSKRGGDYWQDP